MHDSVKPLISKIENQQLTTYLVQLHFLNIFKVQMRNSVKAQDPEKGRHKGKKTLKSRFLLRKKSSSQ